MQVGPGGGNELSTGGDWGIAAASASAAVYCWSISNCLAISSKKTPSIPWVKKKSPLTRVRSSS